MGRFFPSIKALIEVIAVLGLTMLLFRAVYASPLGAWERQAVQRPFLEYVAVMTVPLAVLALTRRSFAAYGIALRNIKLQLDIAATGFLPVALIALVLNVVNWQRWDGAFLILCLEMVLLVAVAWLVRNKPTVAAIAQVGGAGSILLVGGLAPSESLVGGMISTFVFNFVFVGPAEEILFRGYIQSRLGATGRPYQFFGVPWGWGLVATALLFGAWHVVAPLALLGTFDLAWPHGLWTFGAGLLFGFIREKTGSVVAPALLHGILNVL